MNASEQTEIIMREIPTFLHGSAAVTTAAMATLVGTVDGPASYGALALVLASIAAADIRARMPAGADVFMPLLPPGDDDVPRIAIQVISAAVNNEGHDTALALIRAFLIRVEGENDPNLGGRLLAHLATIAREQHAITCTGDHE